VDAATGRRRALAIVTGHYQHEDLPDLDSPSRDAEILQRVLTDPGIGRFDSVEILLNADARSMGAKVYDFFDSAAPDDFLFVYFSGHGRRLPDGRLFLAALDTEPNRLPPTALRAEHVAEYFDSCNARHIILILDCCHAGAFVGEPKLRGSRDRVVILTAGVSEHAHEGDPGGVGPALPSAFAGAFFEGIETGRADSDRNGLITIREAFDYAVTQLRGRDVKQTPQMRAGVSGDVVLCQSPSGQGVLPPELDILVRHSLPAARLVAVNELVRWLGSGQPTRVDLAETVLNDLRRDPDEGVAAVASRSLADRFVRSAVATGPAPVLDPAKNPLWYRRAVFYDVNVAAFADGNGDGRGDLPGLLDRLEYLNWLGVDCLILSPIFESPGRDQGYDIANFVAVDPSFGDLASLIELLDAAHRLEIRVVLDVVLNHTSSEHPWFQASRHDPDGQFGDYYVWRDTNVEYRDAATAVSSSTSSGWTYDPVRRQYFWHQFAAHEPDLNFDHEPVREEILAILRHWLEIGVDGYRLISAPYLFERDGTPCEGLSETHSFLREIRSMVSREYPGRILMAWTEKWPADARGYFGSEDDDGRECHLVMYASLMPRIFLSMRREGHAVLSSFLAQAGRIPADGAWGLFLRNGDEMSLATADAGERDYLLREYAPQPRMRWGDGIRRRLAPLLDGDRGQLELCLSLLLSLPGAPIIFYGDEIGMGENLMLPGTDAMKTPMQWSTERGGGFSDAEPEQFFAPILLGSGFGYQATNVASQRRNPTSLLRVVRQLLEVRRHSAGLLSDDFVEVASSNSSVMAYLRGSGDERMLCVANFSRDPQATEIKGIDEAGAELVEATGGSRFGSLATGQVRLTLPGHGYFWLRLTPLELSA
jgi:trehalose synthase